MRSSESLQEARGRMQSHHTPDYSFSHPKRTTYIGAWNVRSPRSLFAIGKAAQVAKEMEMNRCEILGLSEMRSMGWIRKSETINWRSAAVLGQRRYTPAQRRYTPAQRRYTPAQNIDWNIDVQERY